MDLASFLAPIANAQSSISDGIDIVREAADGAPTSITEIILRVIIVFTSIVGVVAVGAMVFGGFMYITSAGDEQKSSTAKKIILYAIIGLIVVGVSALLVNVTTSIISAGGPPGGGR